MGEKQENYSSWALITAVPGGPIYQWAEQNVERPHLLTCRMAMQFFNLGCSWDLWGQCLQCPFEVPCPPEKQWWFRQGALIQHSLLLFQNGDNYGLTVAGKRGRAQSSLEASGLFCISKSPRCNEFWSMIAPQLWCFLARRICSLCSEAKQSGHVYHAWPLLLARSQSEKSLHK